MIIRRQHGVIGRSQAGDAGMSDSGIRHALESGRWSRIAAGVYVTTSSVPTWERQMNAALLSHPSSIVAGLSAAHLLGFSNVRRGRPEIMMPFEGNGRSPIARVIRSRHFEVVERRIVSGFECTSPSETALTLSMRWPYAKIERFIDDGLASELFAMADFHPILDRLTFARQPGLRSLRKIIAARSSDSYQPPTTELERLLYRLLDHPRLPSHKRQLPIVYPALEAIVDAFIDRWLLIVEGDGRRWHTRQADFELDRKRDNAATAAGLAIVRFTWKDLRFSPEACLRTLLEVGRKRETMVKRVQ